MTQSLKNDCFLAFIIFFQIITSIRSEPLVERYRPKTMKQIIGQQGDKSCAHNLYIWLRDWHQNRQNPKFKDSSMLTFIIILLSNLGVKIK